MHAIGKDNRPKQLAVVESAGTYGINQDFTCVKGRLIGIKKGLNMVIAHLYYKERKQWKTFLTQIGPTVPLTLDPPFICF
jgi:hypothetical protein